MRARLVIAVVVTCLLVGSLVPGVLAAKPPGGSPAPLTVATASLTQSARQLVFKLQTTTSFSTVALRGQGRSLCLLIEAVKGGVTGRLCVIAPVKGRPVGVAVDRTGALLPRVNRQEDTRRENRVDEARGIARQHPSGTRQSPIPVRVVARGMHRRHPLRLRHSRRIAESLMRVSTVASLMGIIDW